MDITIAKEVVHLRLQFTENKALPVLIMDEGVTSMNKEARNYLSSEEKANEEIAAALVLSKRTVDIHRQRIMQKVQARNTTGLIKAAYELKLLEDQINIK